MADNSSIIRRLRLADFLIDAERVEERALEMEMCKRDCVHWFNNWVWTYNPKLAGIKGETAQLPLDLWPRQEELIRFLDVRWAEMDDGLIEKSRDVGFTWLAGGYAVHKWLFVPGFKSTFGSRKGEYVDRIGDPDSIFEKIRMIMRGLPRWMLPAGYDSRHHDNHMRIINPDNENTIRGEAGDDMGRGGRSTFYFVDEAAFLEHAEAVDAATSANAAVRIWGSSVNGMGNLFARKRHGGLRADQIFTFHYASDPRKTPEWAIKEKSRMEEWAWNSEYELDYSASVEGICIPAAWVKAAQRVAKYVKIEPSVKGISGLDVGGGGKNLSVHVARFGAVVSIPKSWKEGDTIEVASNCLDEAASTTFKREDGYVCRVTRVNYDSVGVGHGVGATLKRSKRGMTANGVNVGVPPSEDRVWPDRMTSKEKFGNLKAELWFLARERFWRTYQTVQWYETRSLPEEKQKGHVYQADELVSLPVDDGSVDLTTLISQLSLPKQMRNESGKLVMESKKQLKDRGIQSPDHAEAFILTFDEAGSLATWEKLGKAA